MAVKKRKVKPLGILIILFLLASVFLISVGGSFIYLGSPVDKNDKENIEVEIKSGSSSSSIGKLLKDKGLIRSDFYFKIYLKLYEINDLKATTYQFNKSMSTAEIISELQKGNGYNPDEISITIQEGLNMRQIATIISSKTNNTYDEVIAKSNDEVYIRTLIDKYWFITDDVLNPNIYYKLEGYIYPDTYALVNKDVDVEYIFNKMVAEMAKHLEPYKDFDYSTMTIHQRITLASMVEKEGPVLEDRTKMASVFVNRVARGMSLGSDVTTRYAIKLDEKRPMSAAEYATKSPYNTRLIDGSMNGKLPVGPIAAVSKSSIDAAFNPDSTPYIYFVSNIQTNETFFYVNKNDFDKKVKELESVNKGY